MRFMFLEYGYAGILAQVDFVHLPNERQSIYGAPVQVIDGGWDIQSSFHLNLGVHF